MKLSDNTRRVLTGLGYRIVYNDVMGRIEAIAPRCTGLQSRVFSL